MTIDQAIEQLTKAKTKVGGDSEFAVVRINYGENDYIVPDYVVVGDFTDQDGNDYKCAMIGESGGEEFTEKDTAHYNWKPERNKI